MDLRDAFGVGVLAVAMACAGGCGDDDGAPADGGGGTADGGGGGGDDAGGGDGDGGGGGDDAGGGGFDAGADPPKAVAQIVATGETGSTIVGTATFSLDGDDITVTYEVSDCPNGDHPTHIHAGTGCADRAEQGMHWDGMRGEGIPDLSCRGGIGTLTYSRGSTDPALAWTIGGPAATNVVGHPVIIHGSRDADARIGCGVVLIE